MRVDDDKRDADEAYEQARHDGGQWPRAPGRQRDGRQRDR